jgi:hypothetical protein
MRQNNTQRDSIGAKTAHYQNPEHDSCYTCPAKYWGVDRDLCFICLLFAAETVKFGTVSLVFVSQLPALCALP